MPHTAHVLGVNPRDSKQNLLGASTYLARMIRQFGAHGNHLHLAIAAYNAGPLAVRRAGGIPYNGETPEYVRRVISVWHSIRARVGDVARTLPSTDKFVIGVLSVEPYAEIISVDGDSNSSQPSSDSTTSTTF